MAISNETKQAYSEIDEFLELVNEKTRNQIPIKLRNYFKEEKDISYHKGINPNIPLENQNLKRETLAIIALLNLQYWCKDEAEKKRLLKIYSENQKNYEQELKEKYNPDNIFKKNIKEDSSCEVKQDNQSLIVPQESTNILKKIARFFKRVLNFR